MNYGCFCVYYVVGEVLIQVCSPQGGVLEGMTPRMFLNLRRTYQYRKLPLNNSLFISSLLSHRKEIFPWERGNI
jgi:hypothetical protein